MEASGTIELARQDNPKDLRAVTLQWDQNGITVSTYDIGESVEEFFGDDDYEFSMEVKSKSCLKLLAALIREKYKGSFRATDEMADFCKANDIPFSWTSWP